MLSIQDLGRVDRWILEMESALRSTFPPVHSETVDDAAKLRHAMLLSDCSALSVFWACGLYEAIRNVRDAKMPQFVPLIDLFRKLEIIRMPLAKHEMKGAPGYREKFHYPQTLFFPSTGWVGWKVFNPLTETEEHVARTDIANQFLQITSAPSIGTAHFP